jgi:hypothetical protein
MADTLDRLLPKILEWKKKHGTIYYLKAGSGTYVFRILSRAEYSSLLSVGALANSDLSDFLLKTCLLYPSFNKRTFDKKIAGEVESVIQAIGKCSGFSETDRVLSDIESARESMGTLENQIAILICKAFPHLLLEDIDKFTYEDLVRYIAISEAILDVKLKIEKPEKTKGGAVDFEKENQSLNEPPPFKNKNKQRGAPDK